MDPIVLLLQVAFYLLFAATLWRYVRQPRPVERAVVAVFATTASLFAVSFVGALLPGWLPVLRPVAITALVAQPYLIVRLLGLIWPVPSWADRLALVGFLATTAALLVLGSRSVPAIVAVITYFGIVEAAAAIQFGRLALRRRGSHRLRLALAGIATAMFGLAIVISGLGSVANGGATAGPVVVATGRLFGLLAAVGYLGAFLPPRWLTGFFHRAAAFDLARGVVAAPSGSGPGVLWRQLALLAEGILGARQVEIFDPGGRAVLVGGEPTSEGFTDPSPVDDGAVTIPLLVDGRPAATLRAYLEGRPLFVDDDVAIVALLGSLTARSVQHERDVSRLRETELALEASAAVRASEARFRVFLEADPNAILATDEAGRISWSTRSSAELFGYEDGALVGRPLTDLIDVPTSDPAADEAGPAHVRRVDTTGFRADGSSIPVEVALRRLELDEIPVTLAVVSDSSWRQEANEIRDRFVGILSHELRTPITSIYGGAQVLLKRAMDLDDGTRNELLMGLADESERLQRMIENLLILARVERGADFFGPRPVLIQRVLADVIDHERALWPGITIRVTADEGLPVVSADEDQLSQVMRNLLANAVKYAGDEAHVDVDITVEGGWVQVTVRDDGPGFPPEEAAQLFGLYYRSARSTAAPGAGIGLYVCRHLVEAMGGTMWARSRPEGGAEFGFTLAPYVDADDGVEDGGPTARPTSDTTGERQAVALGGDHRS